MTASNNRRCLGAVVVIALLWGGLATTIAHDDLALAVANSTAGAGSSTCLDESSNNDATTRSCLGCRLFSAGQATLQAATATPPRTAARCLPTRLPYSHRHPPLYRPLSRGPPLA